MSEKEPQVQEPLQIRIVMHPNGSIETTSNIKDITRMIGIMDIAKSAVMNNMINPSKKVSEQPKEKQTGETKDGD